MQNAERQLKKHGKSLEKLGKRLTVGVTGPLAGLAAVSINNFDIQAKAIAQVEAGLKSTQNQVGFTSEALQKMASDLQNNSLFGDEAILQGVTAQLLTFTNIANEQFARTQKIALDLATRLDGDLKSASIQLGKALNDPIKNLSALSRAGIQFTDEQKDMVWAMVKTNRLADAQNLILEELEKQYGGSAEAAAKAGAGPLKQLSNILGDITEEFGRILIKGLNPMIERLTELSLKFQSLSDETKELIVFLGGLAASIGPVVFVIGTLLQNLASITAAIKTLSVVVAANPIGALVTALGVAVVALQLYSNITKEAVKTQSLLSEITEKANESIAKERARLESLYFVAKSEKVSKEQRLKAIAEINRISPEYLGNLTLETINTDKARLAIEKYNQELLKTAKVKAAQEKLEEIQSKIIEEQLARAKEVGEAEKDRVKFIKQQMSLGKTYQEAVEYVNDAMNLGNELSEIKLKKLEEEAELLLEIINSNKSLLGLTKKISDVNGKGAARLNIEGQGIAPVEGYKGPILSKETIDGPIERLSAFQLRLLEFQVQVKEIMETVAQDLIGGFAEIGGAIAAGNANFGDLASFLLETLGSVLINLGKMAIQVAISIEAIKAALKSLNPVVAAAAGVAAIALGSFIKQKASNFAGNYTNGGIIPGSSYSGDKLYAGVNSGELILNLAQQKNIAAALSVVPNVILNGRMEVQGDKLITVIERANAKKSRTT